jgi:hypothetical protein
MWIDLLHPMLKILGEAEHEEESWLWRGESSPKRESHGCCRQGTAIDSGESSDCFQVCNTFILLLDSSTSLECSRFSTTVFEFHDCE